VYADVTSKISRINRSPNLLGNGALLARYVRRLRHNTNKMSRIAITIHCYSFSLTFVVAGAIIRGSQMQNLIVRIYVQISVYLFKVVKKANG